MEKKIKMGFNPRRCNRKLKRNKYGKWEIEHFEKLLVIKPIELTLGSKLNRGDIVRFERIDVYNNAWFTPLDEIKGDNGYICEWYDLSEYFYGCD